MKVNKNTFNYLKNLKRNNNRDWYNQHKADFLIAQSNAKEIFQEVRKNLEKHDKIDRFKLFRIYRDVRFSKDKTPYNPHFAGSFSRMGNKLRGGYYLRIKPGESFLAGGFWEPNKEDLLRIRKEFEFDDSEIREILNTAEFKKYFAGNLEGKELKTAPKGFDKNHIAIDLIRKKGFIAVRNFTNKEVLSDNFIQMVDDSYKALRPFFNYMSVILSTNLNGEPIFE